jgi:polyisoprenyl-phosphate glycosyltransferase
MSAMRTASARPTLSVVSPIYRGANLVDPLVARLISELDRLGESFEIVLVEDGSGDASWARIVTNAEKDARVKGVKLSRNFGQHPAITAGLSAACGEYVVVIDCDLQDNPAYIGELLAKARTGIDVVYTRRSERAHPFFKNLGATIFNKSFNWLSENKQIDSRSDVGAFSLLSRKVVNAFLKVQDYHRHYLLIVRWLGFPSTYIDVIHTPRLEGKSSYSFRKLVRHAIDGITSQSTKLLRLSIFCGLLFCGLAVLATVILIAFYYLQGFKEGWTSLIALMLLSTGMILLSLGVLGIYLGKVFEQCKQRPLFLVETTVNMENASL